MTTLMVTRGGSGITATKIIAGVSPAGAGLHFPATKHPKAVKIDDGMARMKTGSSLRTATAHITRNHLHPTLGLLQWKGINTSVVPQRQLHSDVEFPNFDNYRHEKCLDVDVPASETEDSRRMTYYGIVYGVGGMVTMMIGQKAVQNVVEYKGMPADMRALASVEIDLTSIPPGGTKTFEWRGKPIFVRHRTPEEVEKLRSVDISTLRHPEADEDRSKRADWSVVIGVCTHLGCVPIAGAGDYGAYLCPCHGSHYDGSGRIRKGPAPLNLNVPEYSFKTDDLVVVGKS